MEKFTNWRDKATGISPFIPVPTPKSKSSWLYRAPILILVKLPVLIVLLALILLSSPVGFVQNLWIRLYLLAICNLWEIPHIRSQKKLAGSLVVVNFSSFIDPLLCSLISSNNIFLCNDSKGQIRQISRFELIKSSISNPETVAGNSAKIVKDLSNFPKNSTIWYFAESTTSNGKSILKFNTPSKEFFAGRKICTLTIFKSNWVVTVLPTSWVQLLFSQLSSLQSLKLNFKLTTDVEQDLPNLRNSLLGNKLKLVNLDVNDKISFLQAYNQRNKY